MPTVRLLVVPCLLCLVTALPADELPVRCPAVVRENTPRGDDPFRPRQAIELVVIGAAKPVKGSDDENVYQLQIDKTLYGSWPDKTLLFTCDGRVAGDRMIFALAPGVQPRDCDGVLRYVLDPAEEKAITALAVARFDYHTLSSVCVFIGKELEARENGLRSVEVIRPLAGQSPARGEKVLTEITAAGPPDEKIKLHTNPEIYFIARIDKEAEIEEGKKGTVHQLGCRQPADQEEKVAAALRRQAAYPVVEVREDGEPVKCREVIFLGPVEQAIDLLGSDSDAAILFGQRRLEIDGAKNLATLRTAIEKRLFATKEAQVGDFRRLAKLIPILGIIATDGAEIDAQLFRLMAHIAGQPAEPPELPERSHWERYLTPEEDHDDVNHALTWLLRQVNEKKRHQELGPKLLRLRDQAKGRWKAEVQLALDVGRIEDQIELEAGWKRLADWKPVRSTASGIRHPGRQGIQELAFSADGRYLASSTYENVRVWDLRDWSLAGEIKLKEAGIDKLAFAPDGKLLYVAGYTENKALHAAYDWRTGKVIKKYEGHQERVSHLFLSADGQVMVSASYFEDIIHVWDLASGKIRSSHKMLGHDCALSPDGKMLAYAAKKDELAVVPVAGGPARAIPFEERAELNELVFSPDSKLLIVTRNDFVSMEIRLLSVAEGFKEKAKSTVKGFRCTAATISPDSQLLVVGPQEGPVWVCTLPDLKPIRQIHQVKETSNRARCISLSPDGKVLALACNQPTPLLFNVADWQRLLPASGHADEIAGLYFPADGKTIRTLGRDGTICVWDAASLQMRQRLALENGMEVLTVRPDGQVLIIRKTGEAHVLDADTLRTLCKLELPPPADRFDRDEFYWLDDREVLLLKGKTLSRYDYRAGKLLAKHQPDVEKPLRGNQGYLSEDKKTFYWLSSNPKYGHLVAQGLDLASGKFEKIGDVRFTHFTGNRCGVVPDGKHFYVCDPDLFFYTRDKLELAHGRQFRDAHTGGVAFSSDGQRFAVNSEGRFILDKPLRPQDVQKQGVVRIHESASGKTLGVLPTGGRLHFAPGNRLAILTEDDVIELWDLKTLSP